MIEQFFSGLGTRESALKSDEELRLELTALIAYGMEKATVTARLDAILSERAKIKAERRAAHRKGR